MTRICPCCTTKTGRRIEAKGMVNTWQCRTCGVLYRDERYQEA